MRAIRLAAVVCALTAFAPAVASADEPFLLGISGDLVVPVTSPTFDRFGPGAGVGVEGQAPIVPFLVPVVRLRGAFLSDGSPPADATLRDPGVGSVFSLTLGLRFRLHGVLEPDDPRRAVGFWLELDAGGALTGDLVRPWLEVGAGYGFAVGDVRIGPAVRFQHLVHFDDPLDANSAHLLTIGAELVLFDRAPSADEVPEEAPQRGDRDGDGIFDDEDQCPTEPEDRDAFQDDDGCPDPDNDTDGILDADDGCPLEPEDRDDFEDADGCPDPDNDRDGFPDGTDACPLEPETVNGVDDDDGCPDQGLIQMNEDRIIIEETVLFDLNRARVKHSARPVLQAIVALWRQHPEWSRVRVEGHADERGDAEWNQELSERRAERVRDILVELGMPSDMIEVVGHGAGRPRDTRRTEHAYQRNRRVEFVVVARRAVEGGAALSAPATAPASPAPPDAGSGSEEGGAP